MMRAMSARSPVGGLRYSTSTSICSLATVSTLLMVFHHVSESGAWLTKTNRSPSADAPVIAPSDAPMANAAAATDFRIAFILLLLHRMGRPGFNFLVPEPQTDTSFHDDLPLHGTAPQRLFLT